MNLFNQVLSPRTKLNKFDLSHERKMTLDMGYLYPMYVQEIVPGDIFRVQSEIMLRFAPLLAPILHRVHVSTHFFFVPYRLIWDEWEDFITGGPQGDLEPVMPCIQMGEAYKQYFSKGSLLDYLGFPTLPTGEAMTANGEDRWFNLMPVYAYQEIYNEWYRDQNNIDPIDIDKTSGQKGFVGNPTWFELRKKAWDKDYFTSALPWAQRGGDVELPTDIDYYNQSRIYKTDGSIQGDVTGLRHDALGYLQDDNAVNLRVENIDSLGITINDLRQAVKLQEWLERSARGGSRYIEQILAHFGVHSSDKRLQRPEYLGGGRQPVVISEVLNTTGDTGAATPLPQGNMSGHGISVGKSNRFKRRFEEHGIVMGIMNVMPIPAYHQGVDKMWMRESKYDYYWPEFAHLGEQEIQIDEIKWQYDTNYIEYHTQTFGYAPRYAEYKYKPSTVHGDFHEDLNFWHLARELDAGRHFADQEFIEADVSKRIFAVEQEGVNSLYTQIYHKIDALRPMPYFGTPRL